MSTIFISYRRSDSREFCIRMAAELKRYFGSNTIFFDQTTIVPGTKWPQEIREAVGTAKVVLVVIGSQWLQARDERSGKRRIDIPEDWVREEVSHALKRKRDGEKVEIIPILIGDTQMPDANDLTDELKELSSIHGIKLPDTGSHHDFDRIQDELVKKDFTPKILQPTTTPILGVPPPRLDNEDEKNFLSEYTEWEIVETEEHNTPGGYRRELHRVYEFPNFDLTFEFMTEVVTRGINAMNHHPRWQNTFNRVEVWLTTFNIGFKPSKRDIRLARVFEEIWIEYKNRIRAMKS